ncbi:MAG: peroxiredoxin [Planctomycetota bacterium]
MTQFPDFSLESSDGGTVSRADLTGQPYVIYAYPKDLTPGCTTESCDFRDNLTRIQGQGVRLFGLSPDPLTSHARFIAKHELNFPLLADPDKRLLQALACWKEKKNDGKASMGVERSTWLVGADHEILREWRKVKVDGHVQEVLAAIDELLV